ncbi:hypothetical protein [Gymnodinialimonas sp.]
MASNYLALSAGDDGSAQTFIDTLGQTPTLSAELSANLTKVKDDLAEIIKVLTYPKTVATDLGKLSKVIDTIDPVLTAVSIIPEIGSEVKVIQEALKTIKTEVDQAKSVADKIEARVKPIREGLQKLQPLLADAITATNKINTTSTSFLAHFKEINTCVNSLPDGPPKTAGLQFIAAFAANTTPLVADLNSALSTTNDEINKFYAAINDLKNKLNFLSEISDAVSSLLNDLSPLLGPLSNLMSALNFKITIPTPVPFYGVHVSIKDILDQFKAFTDLAMEILNPILAPILDPLKELAASILNEIPGIKQLLALADIPVPSLPDFASIFSALEALAQKLEAAIPTFTLECPPSAAQSTFSEAFKSQLGDVASSFVGGPNFHILAAENAYLIGQGTRLTIVEGVGPGNETAFAVTLDASRRVVIQSAHGRHISVTKGAGAMVPGPVTKACHLVVEPAADDAFKLIGPDGVALSVDGMDTFKSVSIT